MPGFKPSPLALAVTFPAFIFLTCVVCSTPGGAQTPAHPQAAASDSALGTGADAENRQALRALAEKEALTVRALVGFGRIPASSMAALSGLRAKGIDVLGSTPEQLDTILKEHGTALSPAELRSLGQIAEVMKEVQNTTASSGQLATDPGPSAPTSSDHAAAKRPPLPPMSLPPALPMVELGSAQYAGMITTAKEATRILMGEMSEAQAAQFEKRWASYYDFPSEEILQYYRAATPILTEFLNIRGAIASTSAAFDEAWAEAQFAAAYDSEEGAAAALAQANMLKDYLVSLEARARQLAQAMEALGEPPDPVEAKEEARARHKSAVETIASLFAEKAALEGVWFGAGEGDEDGWIEGIKGIPLLFVVYAVGDPQNPTYRALYLDANDDEDKEDPFIGIFGMNPGDSPDMPGLAPYFGDDSLNHTYEMKDEGETWVFRITAHKLAEGEDRVEYPPPVALDTVEAAYEKMRRKLDARRAELEDTKLGPTEAIEDTHKQVAARMGAEVGLSLSEKASLSELNDIRRHNQWTPIFIQAARLWLKERPFSEKTTLAQDRKRLSALFASMLGPQAPQRKQPALAQTAGQGIEPQEEAAADAKGAPQAEEAERRAKRERIEFHKQNMIIIQRNLERDRAELAKETDPERRAQLEFRIVGAMSDLQSEKDLVASIETDEIVHSRSPFDDYAHAGFVANIRKSQQRMEHFQRSSDALFKLAGMLPGEEGREARAFVERQLTPDVRLNMDQTAVKRIADALGKKVEGHFMAIQAQSDEEAAYANLGLEASQNIKSAADTGMMVASLFGGQYVDAAYQAATGYIEGGPTEAVLRTAALFGPTAGAAAAAMRGYQEGGLEEALKRGAVSFALSKGLEYGMGKVLGKPKTGPDGPDVPTGKKPLQTVDGPDVKTTKSGSVPEAPAAKLPKSADQRALEQFQRARKEGEGLVAEFRQAQKRLSEAGSSGASPEEIRRLQAEVREKVVAVNGNPHAKNFLKYKGDPLSQRAYNAHLRAVHADVEARFHENMRARGWNQQPLKEMRNSSSAGSVGMDFDIGLDEQMVQSLTRDGNPAKVHQWQQDAQKAWEEAYEASTGRSAKQAWETVTTSGHAESYKDLQWLEKDKSKVSRIWGQQAADVTRYKSWHMQADPDLSRMEKLQEIARGAAKDMKTKLDPILDKVRPTSSKGLSDLDKARRHWNQVRKVLADFGENNIDPITADRRIRELTGGKSIPDVVEDMTYLLEGALKFANLR